MLRQQLVKILKSFQNTPAKSKLRREYLSSFEKKMVYRTTKTENPEVTQKQVEKIFKRLTMKQNA